MLSNRQIISLILLFAGIGFIAVLIGRSWGQIAALLASANWALLALSCVVGIASMVVTSLFFYYLLDKHALRLPTRDVHRLFFYGQIAKYVPGKIWGILYQTTSVNQKGASSSIAAANIDLMVISILTNLALGIALVASGISMVLAAMVFLLGLYVTVLASRSILSGKLIGWVLSKLGRNNAADSGDVNPPTNNLMPVILYYGMICLLGVMAYYLMLHAVFSFSFADVVAYIGYLILAWVAGVFLFLAPAGMGVRELVFIAFGTYMDTGVSVDTLVIIAVVSRFWQVFQELGAAAVVFLWNRTGHHFP